MTFCVLDGVSGALETNCGHIIIYSMLAREQPNWAVSNQRRQTRRVLPVTVFNSHHFLSSVQGFIQSAFSFHDLVFCGGDLASESPSEGTRRLEFACVVRTSPVPPTTATKQAPRSVSWADGPAALGHYEMALRC